MSKMKMPANKIIFMHAEKTGGSTAFAALRNLFADDKICPERHEQIGLLPKQHLDKYAFFCAHATIEDLNDISRPAFLMTILRDPVERSLSLYDFWRSHSYQSIEKNNLYGPRLAKSLSAKEFFDRGNNWRTHATNRYTEMLLGGSADRSGNHIIQNVDEKAEKAIAVLERFDFVGITELMDRSFDELSELIDCPTDILTESKNISYDNRYKDPNNFDELEDLNLDDEIIEMIAALNASDQIIYKHALSRFIKNDTYDQSVKLRPYPGTSIRRGRSAAWHSNQNGGLILFGPYMRLRPGKYEAVFQFGNTSASHNASKVEIDVVAAKASNVFFRETVYLDQMINNRYTIKFSISSFANDLEFRVNDLSGGTECDNCITLKRFI